MDGIRAKARKGRFGTIVWWLGVLSTGALVATVGQGFTVVGANRLKPHLFLALASTLVIFFCHLWIAIYLRVLRREVRKHPAGSTEGPEIPAAGTAWAAAALFLVLATFLLGPISLQGALPMGTHAIVGYLALAAQLAALRAERRDLAAADHLLSRLYAADSPPR